MTVSVALGRNIDTCNGVTTVRTIPFKLLDATHVKIYPYTISTGSLGAALTLNSDYTIQNIGSDNAQYTTIGGSSPWTNLYKLVVVRDVPFSQSAAYVQNDSFPAATHEAALDKLTMICQQMQDTMSRAVVLPVSSDPTLALVLPTPIDGYGLIWSGIGGTLVNTATSLATLQTQAAALYSIAANITTVAGISANVTTVAGLSANIASVITNMAAIIAAPTQAAAAAASAAAAAASAASALGGYSGSGYVAGRYYTGLGQGSWGGSTLTVTAGRQYFVPAIIGKAVTLTKIGIKVATGAGTNCRLGIYNMANGVPTTLVVDAGAVTVSGTGIKEATINVALNPGAYAFCAIFDNTPTVDYYQNTGNENILDEFWGMASWGASSPIYGAYSTQAYGALPDPYAGSLTYTASSATMPIIYVRA